MVSLQNYEDKKTNKQYDTLYDEYKYPVLVCAIVGISLNLDLSGNGICFDNYDTITIVDHIDIDPSNNTIKTHVTGNIDVIKSPVNMSPTQPANELNIHTQLPNF
jgi:hypothetical protein